jgi:hypothetical protein
MREGDREFEALREAIAALAADAAPALVAEARAEACARVRSMLSDAIAHEMLERSRTLLEPAGPAEAQRRPISPAAARPQATSAEPATEAVPPRPAADAPVGCYVYGVTRQGQAGSALGEAVGVDGGQIREVALSDLAALVSDVSLLEFGEEPLRENLNDVQWLEQTARAHERALDAAMDQTTVVPMRLCTIYHGEEQVREMLDGEGRGLREALDRLEGKTEWGVKVIAEPEALTRAAADDPEVGDDPELSPGLAYLEARRRETQAGRRVDGMAEDWGNRVHERLATVSFEALRNPLQAPEIAGYEGEMVLNGVYLVDDRDEHGFRKVVDVLAAELAPQGISLELTGPWPPYNFVNSIEAAR